MCELMCNNIEVSHCLNCTDQVPMVATSEIGVYGRPNRIHNPERENNISPALLSFMGTGGAMSQS